MSGLNSLATVIRRLEAATSRIEDVSVELENKYLKTNEPHEGMSPSVYDTLRRAAPGPAPSPPPPPPPPPPALAAPASAPVTSQIPKSVVAYDDMIITGKLKPFLQLTRAFGGASLTEQADLVEKLLTDLRAFLLAAAHCQKPDQQTLNTLLTPLQADIEAVSRLKEANRKDREWFTHLSTVAEGAPCVGWVTVPSPGPYVNEIKDSTEFYGNRVIKEYKEKDPRHAEWVKSYVGLLAQMRLYVVEHFKMGLIWNPSGVPVAKYNASASASPPPPPAPAPSSGGGSGAINNVFADLNRGEAVTKGLKKVEKTEMTHKNPALRASSVVPATSSSTSAVAKPAKPTGSSGKVPAKFALDGNKWVIEGQENQASLVIDKCEINQTVNLFGCRNSTIQIKGKVNAVSLLNCTKTSVLMESVISAVTVTNSPSFAIQITGSAPTIQVDTTDSGQIYLSRKCLGVEITTAKCSSINISLPVEGEEEGVFSEQAVPEMLKTVIKDGKLVTTVVEHVG